MIRTRFKWSRAGLWLCVLGFAFFGASPSTLAQQPEAESGAPTVAAPEKAASPADPASPAPPSSSAEAVEGSGGGLLERVEVEARLKAAEAAADPDNAASEALVDHYKEALSLYDAAEEQRARLDSYVAVFTSAPEATQEAQASLAATPELKSSDDPGDRPPPGLSDNADVDEINNQLSAARAAELLAKKKFDDLEATVVLQQTRPDAIQDRISAIRQGISDAETVAAKLKSKPDATDVDDALWLKTLAQIAALNAELATLEQEKLSYDARLALVEAQRDLAGRLASNAAVETAAVESFADRRLKDSVSEAAMAAEQARTGTEDQPEVVREVAERISELATEFEAVDRKIAEVSSAAHDVETRLSDLQLGYDRLRAQIGIGGAHQAQGEILLEQRRLMPHLRTINAALSRSLAATSEARLLLFRINNELRDSPETVAADLLEDSKTSPTGAARDRVLGELITLVAKRNDLLLELSGQYRRLLSEEAAHDDALRQLAELTAEAESFLNEKLIWVRSSEPISLSTFTEFPGGLAWLFRTDRPRELGAALAQLWERSSALVIMIGMVFLILILTRSRCKRGITDLGRKIQKISTDRYQFTFKAFLFTLVLALPYPVFLAFLGWGLLRTPDASDWLQGLAEGLLVSGYLLAEVLFIRALCRKGGVGEQHFRWPREPSESLRENLTWISILYIPVAIVSLMTLNEKDAAHLASLGRLTFIATMLWMAFFIRRMLDEQKGVTSRIIQEHPQEFVARLQKFWKFLFVSFPLAMVILALAGYTLTGYSLNRQFRLTLEIVGIGVVVYAMILRWFSMRERKLSLEQRFRERRERAEAEARETEGADSVPSDESGIPDFDEESIDFEEVGDQTRRLLRFVVGSAVGLAVWFGWADVVPALRGLDAIKIMGSLSLGALIPAIFILIVTTIGAKNLPGLLEIAVLRHLPLDAGLRYAITALCQYAVVAVGLSLAAAVLGIDWSKLGWIVAALSVGLGFGLQEVVANFVCGIILLFERPIRVGDVVTVSGTTGIVSRIRIRATTILDRDQKEFIVPNKEFITGSLLNWTLSTTLIRIVIVVGVAYGSNTRRARDLLLEICNAHPDILQDPATTVVFDAFGDSTLNFTVRSYLASMENRLGVTNDLHHEIHERFAAEGIEIAFPQMDLHLRSIDPGVRFGGGSAPEPGKT